MTEQESDASLLEREPIVRRRFTIAIFCLLGTLALAGWAHWIAADKSYESFAIIASAIAQLTTIYFGRQFSRLRIIKTLRQATQHFSPSQHDLPLNKPQP